jgi:hypothetical protein
MWGRAEKKWMGEMGKRKPERKKAEKMRVRCVSTTTSDEKARVRGVGELVDAVRAYVGGTETTKVEVEGGPGVEEVVAALKEAKVVASAGGRETRGRRNGLDVVAVVKGVEGDVQFVWRVQVVAKVAADEEVEIAGRVWKRRNLRATEYNDGAKIARALTVRDFVAMSRLKTPAYFMDEKSGNVYYNRHVDVSERGVSPAGWGLPTNTDVWELVMHYDAYGALNSGRYNGPAAAALTDPKGDFKAEMTGYITVPDGSGDAELAGYGDGERVARLWNRGQSDVWWDQKGGSGCFEVGTELYYRDEWNGSHQYEGNAIRLLKKRP